METEKLITVHKCARCGFTHPDLKFKKLTNPIEDCNDTIWDWWTLCPVTQEPILLRIQEKPSE
jgi:hypothetical protein